MRVGTPPPSGQLRASYKFLLTIPKKRGRSRRGRGTGKPQEPQLTSHSTSRAAYAETRRWLLERHGPICAYCGRTYKPLDITLDHVAPRRGRSAYDRRDNLVLACKPCNAAKADMPLLAFLFRNRARAVSFVRYADHLSPMLLDLVRPIAAGMGAEFADADSPYRDVNWKEPTREVLEVQVEAAMAAMDAVYEDGAADDDVNPYAD